MSYKKIRTFSIFLLFGIAAIFFPATALQNSIARGQEFYPEYDKKMNIIMIKKDMIHTKIIIIMIIIRMLQ